MARLARLQPGTTAYERNAPDAHLVTASLAGSRLAPFWIEDAPARADRATLRGERDCGLLVLGGGYTGLWAAVHAKLRDPDRRVIVLEARRTGWAASGRNGGFCEASLTHGEANGRSRWPDEYDTLHELGLRNLDELAADVTRLGIDAQLDRTGTLTVAVEPHQVHELEDSEGFLDADGVRRRIDSPLFLAGAFDGTETALVHPARLVEGLAVAAEELGVEIYEHSPGRRLDAERDGVRVRTDDGVVRADRMILATNAFPSLLRRYRWHTVPVFDYALMTEPLTAAQRAAIGWEGREGLADMANQFHYARPTADGRLLWGGYDAVYYWGGATAPAHYDRLETFERLASHFFATFPQLEGLRFSHRWSGVIDTSTRFSAFLARAHGDRVAHVAGFTGLGVGASRFMALAALDAVDGLDTERTRLEMLRTLPTPFPPEPFASLGINLTRHALDRADHREGRRGLFLRALDAVGMGFDS
ncbi:MAG: FAD-dependent oxidoreductase [Actinomycetales bacterium]|nr:FAD-dependent oxidoreductase [Actinomycetales bacterium]